MRPIIRIVTRALIIALAWASIGVGINLISAEPAPWIYEPPKSMDIEGVKVRIVNEKQAMDLLRNPDTVFLDSRKLVDYKKSHVKGSIFLGPDDAHDRFVSVEPLLQQDSLIVLYCYGPECDMAERVAEFLVKMGYRNLAIMVSGFSAWEKAGYPVDTAKDSSNSFDYRDEEEDVDICCEISSRCSLLHGVAQVHSCPAVESKGGINLHVSHNTAARQKCLGKWCTNVVQEIAQRIA